MQKLSVHYVNIKNCYPVQVRKFYDFCERELKYQDNLLVKEPHPQSLAALRMMERHFRRVGRTSNAKWIRGTGKNKGLQQHFINLIFKNHARVFCFYCNHELFRREVDKNGKKIRNEWTVTVDHFIPISKDSLNAICLENLRPACKRCNDAKNNKILA
jgi:hypothetical protein